MTETDAPPVYPLGENALESLKAASGKPLDEITLQALMEGRLSAGDLRIRGETLRQQAEIARQAGYERLAANLERAAELARVEDAELLAMYEALRPGRSTHAELIALAERLENEYRAPLTAKFIHQAAEVYAKRGLVSNK